MSADVKFTINSQDKSKAGIDSAKKNLSGLDKAVLDLGKNFTALATVAGLGILAKKIGDFSLSCVNEFATAERAQLRLQSALGDGRAFDKATNFINQISKSYNGSKDDIEGVTSALSVLGKSNSQIEAITKASVNLANTTGQDLNSSYLLLSDTFEGKISAKLQKLIPELGNLSTEQLRAGGATDLINKKLQSMSDTISQGTAQKITNLSENFGDLAENIGSNMAPVFNPFLDWLDSVITKSNDAFTALEKLQTAREKIKGGAELGTQDKISLVQERINKLDAQKTALEINSKFDVGVKLQLALWNKLHGEDLANSNKQLALLIQQQAIEGKIATLTEDALLVAQKEKTKGTPQKTELLKMNLPSDFGDMKDFSNFKLGLPSLDKVPQGVSESVPIKDVLGMGSGIKFDFGSFLSPLLNALTPLITSLSTFKMIIDPISVVAMGMMDVLAPVIDTLLIPLIGILRVFGQLLGMFIAPLLNMLFPVINLITKGFIFLYNYALVPVQNFFIDLIELIGNAFIFIINGIIKAINKIPGVDINKVKKIDMDNQKASKINMNDVMTAGSTAAADKANDTTNNNSASYTGKQTINFYYYQQAPIYGTGGIKELANNLKEVYDANLALGLA